MEQLVSLSKIIDAANNFIVTGKKENNKDFVLYYKLENYTYRRKKNMSNVVINRNKDYTGFSFNISEVFQDRSNGDLHCIVKNKDNDIYIILEKKDILEMSIDTDDKTITIYSRGIKNEIN